MFSGASGFMITGGTWVNATNNSQSKRGFELLMDLVATDAMHNSDELYDAPKCHPNTRIAVLDDIMNWVVESEALEDFIMWLYGPAGAGKSAIAKKIAELAAEKGLLIGSFFFSRTSSTRNVKDRLIPTLAYQLKVSIPGTHPHIEDAIDRDPAIFKKNLETQIDALLIKPFQSTSLGPATPFPKLIIIDGLDECSDSQAQVTILNAISRSFTKHKLPIIFLVVSRPEVAIVTSFSGNEPLKSIHRRLALDDDYHPDDDIRLYLSDKFEHIASTHRLRSTIPVPWPTEGLLETLVKKASGQFIFAATVVRFVESMRHRPAARLNIILGKSLAGTTINPFTELDVLYKQILSSVDGIQLTLHVLSLYTSSPDLAYSLGKVSMSEQFLSLEEGDIELAVVDLSSIVSYDTSSGVRVRALHASFVDFLSDPRRSGEFYIDMASARTDFICRTLQWVKGPDGFQAGYCNLFLNGITMGGWILNDQLKSEILDFDLDAFIAAVINSPYGRHSDGIIVIFCVWMSVVIPRAAEMGFEDRDVQFLYRQCRTCFESRIQKYQSHWRLQLLLTVTVVRDYLAERDYHVPWPRCMDILLEMEDHKLHLADQDALDLRHSGGFFSTGINTTKLSDIISRYVDADKYASAALHCMRFLSNPPIYSETENNDSTEMGITYDEWKETCCMTLDILCELLDRANTSPEVMQFMSDHDIDKRVQKNLPVIDIWRVDAHILAFLSRGGACVNWRIISAVLRKQRDSRKHTDVSPMHAICSTFQPKFTPRCPLCSRR